MLAASRASSRLLVIGAFIAPLKLPVIPGPSADLCCGTGPTPTPSGFVLLVYCPFGPIGLVCPCPWLSGLMYDPVSGSTARWVCEWLGCAKDVDAERGEGELCALRMPGLEMTRDAPPSGSTPPACGGSCCCCCCNPCCGDPGGGIAGND